MPFLPTPCVCVRVGREVEREVGREREGEREDE